MNDLRIRDSVEADLTAIHAIYSHEVLHGLASFEERPPSQEELANRRRRVLDLNLPFLVAELGGAVVGYAYANRYRSRSAYRNAIENSVYVAPGLHGLGIGSMLLSALIDRCERGPWRQMIAVIGNSENTGSIRLHSRLGFRQVGVLHAVGYKLGKWVDTVIMQRPLGIGDRTGPACDGIDR